MREKSPGGSLQKYTERIHRSLDFINEHLAGEIRRLVGKVEEKGLTLIPLEIYFSRGHAKVTLALARGRKLHDKREALKRRMQEREARRAMGARGGEA